MLSVKPSAITRHELWPHPASMHVLLMVPTAPLAKTRLAVAASAMLQFSTFLCITWRVWNACTCMISPAR